MHAPAAVVFCTLCFAAGILPAQATWTVDALNRPGTQFLDLPPAVQAAAPGDVIVVRYANPLQASYTAPTIAKALTLIGSGGQPGLTGNLVIQLVAAGQTVAIRDFQLAPFAGPTPVQNCGFAVRFNQGTVHLHNVDRVPPPGASSALNSWRIENNNLVTLSYCSVDMVDAAGTLVMKDTPQITLHASVLQPAAGTTAPTLSVDNCELVLTDSTVVGSGIGTTAPAIEARNTTIVRIAGAACAVVTTTGTAAVRGMSTNQTVVVGNGAFIGPVAGVVLQQQSISAFAGRIGTNNLLQVTMYGDPLGIGVFAVGPPLLGSVPLFGGGLWLDPALSGFADVIAFDFTGRGTWQLQLPPQPGLQAWLQGVGVGLANTFRLTPPAVVFSP